jgi:hypothetical protein
MEKILALLTKLFSVVVIPNRYVPPDKQEHFWSGAIGAGLLSIYIGYWAILIVTLIALAKEVYDYLHPLVHTCDFFDWLATTLGGVTGLVIIYFL